MLNSFSTHLKEYAKGWLVLILMALYLFFNIVVMNGAGSRLKALSGGTGPIDLEFFYTPATVYSMVASYGEEGRSLYRTVELTADIVYPIVYTLFFSLLITWLFARGFSPGSKLHGLIVLPFFAWIFDMLENTGIVTMLSIYPSMPS
ncbi:MAG: hypothetical protein WCL00_09425, partial [Bacteroidota bacterium]